MLLRRHHITSFLQALLVCFVFTSCARDYFSDDFVGKDESNSTFYYLTVQIQLNDNSLSTRATNTNGDDLEYGEHDEHMIGKDNNIIILFKKDKNNVERLFGVFPLTSLTGHEHNTEDGRPNEETQEPGTNNDNNVDDNIEAIHRYSTKFPADGEAFLPTSCLVVLNSSEAILKKLEAFNAEDKIGNTSVDDILCVIWDKDDAKDNPRDIGFADTDHQYFTMTNSIYFDDDKKQAEVAILEGFIAKSLMAAKPVTIRVERMVAKFSFYDEGGASTNHVYNKEDDFPIVYCDGFTEQDDEDDAESYAPKLVERHYKICLTGWGLNAFETKNYIFKKINNNDNPYFGGWNNPLNYRAHWSEDPHYNYDEDANKPKPLLKYPWQYRLAVNRDLDYYKEKYPKIEEENTNYLKNYTFEELNDGEFDKIVYTPENTYDPTIYDLEKDFDSRTDLLAGTHLIVCAVLETDLQGENEYKPNDVYRDRKGVFYKNQKDCFWSLARAFNLALQTELEMKFAYYDWGVDRGYDGKARSALTTQIDYKEYNRSIKDWDEAIDGYNNDEGTFPEPTKKDFTSGRKYFLYHNETPVTYDYIMGLNDNLFIDATIKDGDGKVLPWLEGLNIRTERGEKLRIYKEIALKYDDKGERVIVGEECDDILDDDWDDITKSIILEWMGAVDHFNEGKMYYAAPVMHNATSANSVADSDAPPKTGDYGVVRNNWYKFRLQDVTKIGTPVDDPTEPIVPNKVQTNDQLNMTIDILPWHEFDLQAPF